MCGRFTLTVHPEELMEQFSLDLFPDDFQFRYNIAPTQPILTAVQKDGKRRAGYIHWGLVPSWVKEPKNWKPLINARSETVHEKASFKHLLNKRRCIIFADSFYEWKKSKDGHKIPYRIFLKSKKPFAFAGLWDRNHSNRHPITCTILTTKANHIIQEVHDRMPVIFTDEVAIQKWLNVEEHPFDELTSLMAPIESEWMEKYVVSSIVNNTRNDNEKCIEPIV